jgi:nucleotide-binding universal stress UspA family protein
MHEILVPLDGTKAAETALPWAAYAARRSSATLHLLSVIPLESSGNGAIAAREAYLRSTEIGRRRPDRIELAARRSIA